MSEKKETEKEYKENVLDDSSIFNFIEETKNNKLDKKYGKNAPT
jgi:hypothetical protein